MTEIIDSWDCTGRGDFILTLSERMPEGFYKKCRIDGKEYQLVPVHMRGVSLDVLLKTVGIKSAAGNFVGKKIEFIKEEQ